jgi:mono/diheme cytochrome c family protein
MTRGIVGLAVLVALACAGIAVQAQDASARAPEIERGKAVYNKWCVHCHGPGLGLPGFGALPGTQQLGIKYRGSDVPPVLDERTDLVPEFIEVIVRQGISFMPQFRKTEVSDADLEALSAYLTRDNPESR